MKNPFKKAIIGMSAIALASCFGGHDNRYPTFPDLPSQAAQKGFEWEIVSGAGLQLWAQRDSHTCVVTDALLQGAVVEQRDSLQVSRRQVIRMFPLKNGKIEDVLELLRATPGWDDTQTGKFEKKDCDRKGVTRYVLVPDGDYADKIKTRSAREAIPSTCNGWGTGSSGTRYFEIHDNHPDCALFVEIGQEAPLFDPESITLSDVPEKTVKGELVIGHATRSFVSCGDTARYWIVDRNGQLLADYDQATQGVRNGYPVYAELTVKDMGRSGEGLAAGCTGVYEVVKTGKVQTVEISPDINHDSRKIEANGFSRIVTRTTVDVVYTPTPGERNVEITAPDNLMQYMETFVDRQGTFLLNMKRFPHIASPNHPTTVELKTPPVTSVCNDGSGLLILKNGIESDTTLHIDVNGDILCGPINCQDLYISLSDNNTLTVGQQIRCNRLYLKLTGNGTVKMESGLHCDSLDIRMDGSGNVQIAGINGKDIKATSRSNGRIRLSGACTNATFATDYPDSLSLEALQAQRTRIENLKNRTK